MSTAPLGKVQVIINGARRGWTNTHAAVVALCDALRRGAAELRCEVSRSAEHGRQLVISAGDWGADTLIIGGGDGTLHELANAEGAGKLALGALPMGTINALCRSVGTPLSLLRAAEAVAEYEPRLFHPLQVAGRRSLCFISVGYDARVVAGTAGIGKLKRILGRFAYVVTGLKHMVTLPAVPRIEVRAWHKGEAEPRLLQGYGLIASRIANYAGFNMFRAAGASADQLEYVVLRSPSPIALMGWAVGRLRRGVPVTDNLAWKLEVKSLGGSLHMQADGEPCAETPQSFTVEVAPPLSLLVPRDGRCPGLTTVAADGS